MKTEMNIDLAIRYIKGRISDVEKEQFQNWLLFSETNSEKFEEFKRFWELSGQAYHNYEPKTTKGWEIISQKTILKTKNRFLNQRYLKFAASILIVISIGLTVKLIYDWTQKEEIITFKSANNLISVLLSDSSKVWLNAQSELRTPKEFKGKKRIVYLKGEAFFEVAKNPKRPFRIKAQNSITEVVGTSFNLQSNEKDSIVSISVVTGKVSLYKIDNTRERIFLLPGQKGICNLSTGKLSIEKNKNSNFLAWKTGKLQFDKASLDEVCGALSDYYRINISPGNYNHTDKFLFTGNFDNASLKKVLSVVELTLGIKFYTTHDTLRIQQ